MPQFNHPLNKDADGQKVTATYENGEWVTPVRVRPAGLSGFDNGAVTVTTFPVELKAKDTVMSNRYQMIVYPPPAGTIYWGGIDVSSANGIPLNAGDPPLTFDFFANVPISIYAVSDGTNRTVKVVEAK